MLYSSLTMTLTLILFLPNSCTSTPISTHFCRSPKLGERDTHRERVRDFFQPTALIQSTLGNPGGPSPICYSIHSITSQKFEIQLTFIQRSFPCIPPTHSPRLSEFCLLSIPQVYLFFSKMFLKHFLYCTYFQPTFHSSQSSGPKLQWTFLSINTWGMGVIVGSRNCLLKSRFLGQSGQSNGWVLESVCFYKHLLMLIFIHPQDSAALSTSPGNSFIHSCRLVDLSSPASPSAHKSNRVLIPSGGTGFCGWLHN